MSETPQPGLLSRHLFLSLYLPAVILSLGTGMVAPVIPVFAKSFDISLGLASLVFAVNPIGAFVATLPAGILMDKIGRRPVLLAGPFLIALSSFLTPFAGSFIELLLYRFIAGAATQLWQQARLTVIADTVPADQRARQVTWMQGMARGGTLFGPAIGGFLAAAFGFQVPFYVHAAVTLLAIIPTFHLVAETAPGRRVLPPGQKEEVDPGWRGVIGAILAVQMLVFLTVQFSAQVSRGGQDHGSLSLYAVYVYGVGPDVLGIMTAVAVLVSLPVPFITGYLMDRFSRKMVVVPGFALYAASLVLMSLTGFMDLPFLTFFLLYVLVHTAEGTTGGTMQVMGSDLAPPFARGRFFAIWRSIAQLGSIISPALFGLVAEHVSYGAAFITLAVFALVVVLLVGLVLRLPGRAVPAT